MRSNRGYNGILLRASERSEHTVVLSLTFLSIYIYSVTKILRKIRATNFTENYRKLCVMGDELTPLPNSLGSATLYPFSTR